MTQEFISQVGAEEIGVRVFLITPKGSLADPLEMKEYGTLSIPEGVKPVGFDLELLYMPGARVVFSQKNVAQTKGEYHRHTLAKLSTTAGIEREVRFDHIAVKEEWDPTDKQRYVRTEWHSEKSNRSDGAYLDLEGRFIAFLVGVITYDNGKTFQLLCEPRWRGCLYQAGSEVVAKPESPKWGPFPETRRGIFKEEEFQKLLATATLPAWNGSSEELAPSIDLVPSPGYARVKWFSPYAGRGGQGIAFIENCTVCQIADRDCGDWCEYCRGLKYGRCVAWIHQVDILDPSDSDGIKRLWYNNLVSYQGEPQSWGTKKGPPRLLQVKRVQ